MGSKRDWLKTLLLAVLASSTILYGLSPPPAHAQSTPTDGFAASISPLPILLSAKPGSSVSADLRVNNPSTHDEKLKVVIKTFTQDGVDGKVNLHDPTPSDDFINWISFNKPVFDAPPGLWQTVKMTINIPKTAAFGYYFAVEFTDANPPAKQTGTGTSIQGAVASFVLLNAQAPGETKQLRVTSFSADHQVYEFLPVNFSIRVHNAGNIFASAVGNIFIMRGSKQVATLNVNENHGLVIPGSNRLFNTSWDSGFPVYKTVYGSNGQPLRDSQGNIKKKLSWNFSQVSKLRFGHYTAKLALVYNDGQRDVPITGSLSFWVVPWRVVGGLAVILIFMTVGFWSTFKHFGRFAKRRTNPQDKGNKNGS